MRHFRSRPTSGPAAVYLIHRCDRSRFKVGWALDPLLRAQDLPEYRRSLLDLRSSLALWLATRQRAQEVERAMHKCLAPFQAAAGHHGDGHRVWFSTEALGTAVRLLRQMPASTDGVPGDRCVLKPLLTDMPELLYVDPEQSPQDAWIAVEDLWLRMAVLLPTRLESAGGHWHLVFEDFRHALDGEMAALRMRALDVDTFGWFMAGQRGSLVKLIAYEGDDLVFTVTSIPTIVRWPQGDDLGWQIQGFLARIRARQGREAVGVSS